MKKFWIITNDCGIPEAWLCVFDEKGLVLPIDGPFRVRK